MTTFAINTLGCKVNAYESEGYVEGLLAFGYKQVDFKEKSDIYIINTCAVTNAAASKSKQKIHQAKRNNPNALICVVGCLVQTTQENLDVDIQIGSSGKDMLASRIKQAIDSHEKGKFIEKMDDINNFEKLPIHSFLNQTRAYLKIQDGCNQFCSYCIIPYARGKERSLPMEDVLHTAHELVLNNHKEIVLSGIHTGRYGHDINTNLLSLLKELVKIEGLERIRISSIEMNEISDDFIAFMKQNDKIARHLHIPVQSCSNRVLKNMNRHYTIEKFMNRIEYIKEQLPGISVSTDIIMGFPDESYEDLDETLMNLETIQFSFLHVFPFSKRDGTKACEIQNHLTNVEKKRRCKMVSLLSKKHYNEYKTAFIGKNVSVLFEYEKDGYLFGHSSEYLPVKARLDKKYINTIQSVLVNELKDDILYCE